MGKTFSTGLLTNGLAQDSSNNIGIGGAASGSFKLQVTGNTNLFGSLNGQGAGFSGNVTIGNPSSALAQFHIYNSSAAASMLVQTNSAADYSEIAARNFNQTSTCYYRQYSSSASGTDFGASRVNLAALFSNFASNFAIGTMNGGDLILGTANTERLRITASTGAATFSSSVTAANFSSSPLSIAPYLDLTYNATAGLKITYDAANAISYIDNYYHNTVTSQPYGDITFRTKKGGVNTLVDALTIKGFTGNVGIGTSSPSYALTVGQAGSTSDSYIQIASTTTGTGNLFFGDATGQGSSSYSGYIQYQHNVDAMVFGTTNTERMRITSGGSLGVATSSPIGGVFKLQVGDGSADTRAIIVSNQVYQLGFRNGAANPVFYDGSDESGNRIFSNNAGTQLMRITSGGQLQIKQAANAYGDGLRIFNTISNNWTFVNGGDSNLYFGYNSSDRGQFNNATGVYTALSDINKKKDFEVSTIGLDAILGLKPTLYRMTDEDNTEKHLGFIAQEVKDFIPQAYVESGVENKFIGLNYNAIVAALVKSIQEQQAQIEELKALIAAK